MSKSQPSKETLEKVQQMKKRVEKTIKVRLDSVKERRLRTLKLTTKVKELKNTGKANDDQIKNYEDQYYKEERKYLRKQRQKMSVKDFTLVKVIGKGAFGEVRIVRDKHTKKAYAMKTMRKKDMVAKNQVTHVQAERDLMAAADNAWLVKLNYSFQDDTYLYLVMEYCGGGDLMTILMREDILKPNETRFYMAELGGGINAVHELGFVHRDLKPDNILISNKGHVKLSDFGLAKSFTVSNDRVISKYQQQAKTLKDNDKMKNAPTNKNQRENYREQRRDRKLMYSTVGTPDYIAPEVFSQKGYDKMVDWWSMGVIMFECLIGYPPFYADDPLQTCRKIVHYRKYFKIPAEAQLDREPTDIIHNLVCSHRRRYSWEQIKNHPFFKTVPFDNMESMKPPYIPDLSSDVDSKYFDTIEPEQNMADDYKASKATDKSHFWGYTFKRGIDMDALNISDFIDQFDNDDKKKKSSKLKKLNEDDVDDEKESNSSSKKDKKKKKNKEKSPYQPKYANNNNGTNNNDSDEDKKNIPPPPNKDLPK